MFWITSILGVISLIRWYHSKQLSRVSEWLKSYLPCFNLSTYRGLVTVYGDTPESIILNIGSGNGLLPVALKFDRHLGSSAAEMPVKFQSNMIIITPILRLRDFTRFGGKMSYSLVNRGTGNGSLSHYKTCTKDFQLLKYSMSPPSHTDLMVL